MLVFADSLKYSPQNLVFTIAEANPVIKPSQGMPLFLPGAARYLIRNNPFQGAGKEARKNPEPVFGYERIQYCMYDMPARSGPPHRQWKIHRSSR